MEETFLTYSKDDNFSTPYSQKITPADTVPTTIPAVTNKLLLNDKFKSSFEEIININERNEKYKFNGFKDEHMIYYFIHRDKYDDSEKTIKENTKKEYARDLRMFYDEMKRNEEHLRIDVPDWIEGSLLKNLKPRHIRGYQKWLVNKYKATTRARKNVIIKSFIKWLYENKYIHYPLHSDFLRSTVSKKELPNRDLNIEEVQSLLNYYKKHPINRAILLILITTGLRVSELANAKWKNLYYDSSILGGKFYLYIEGKNESERDVLIMQPVFEALQAFRERRGLSTEIDPNDPYPLLVTNRLKPYKYKYLSNYVKRIIIATNLDWLKYKDTPVTPHFFRHFFIEYSKQKGASIRDIQLTVQHKNLQTTEGYLSSRLAKENDVALLWDENLFK